jgi:hypothetical protein
MAGVVIPGRPGSGWRTTWHSVVARSPGLRQTSSLRMIAAVAYAEIEDRRVRLGPRLASRGARTGAARLRAVLLDPSGGSAQLPSARRRASRSPQLCSWSVIVMPQRRRSRQLLQRMLEWRVLVATGLASDNLCLWHEPRSTGSGCTGSRCSIGLACHQSPGHRGQCGALSMDVRGGGAGRASNRTPDPALSLSGSSPLLARTGSQPADGDARPDGPGPDARWSDTPRCVSREPTPRAVSV